jgi:hypothetical protein
LGSFWQTIFGLFFMRMIVMHAKHSPAVKKRKSKGREMTAYYRVWFFNETAPFYYKTAFRVAIVEQRFYGDSL